MSEKDIYIIGDPEIVRLFGLLGIEGTELENPKNFIKIFNEIIKDKSIGMIFIALDLSTDEINFLMDFKLNNLSPLIVYLPNIFETEIDKTDIFYRNILDSIYKIIR
ncbi:MAG: V-type ATP synthase subunit F [Promethearchaeota archaeon]